MSSSYEVNGVSGRRREMSVFLLLCTDLLGHGEHALHPRRRAILVLIGFNVAEHSGNESSVMERP